MANGTQDHYTARQIHEALLDVLDTGYHGGIPSEQTISKRAKDNGLSRKVERGYRSNRWTNNCVHGDDIPKLLERFHMPIDPTEFVDFLRVNY